MVHSHLCQRRDTFGNITEVAATKGPAGPDSGILHLFHGLKCGMLGKPWDKVAAYAGPKSVSLNLINLATYQSWFMT